MELLEQCQKWHEEDEHQKIADALEAIPAEERTAEMDMELARAYNNLADPSNPEGKKLLRRAVKLMQAHEEQLGETYFWNFRMGYAWYYLDQEGRARRHFAKALELHPGDDPKINTRQDIEELLEDCGRRLSLPQFATSFRERTEKAWEAFAEQEERLRQLMDEDTNHERGDELVEQCDEILHLAFENIAFELGFNGEKHELILTPEGDSLKLFQLVYFQQHAPEKVLERWSILVGRQPVKNIGLRADGWEISGDDVQVWVKELGKDRLGLSVYCKKLLPLLQEEEGRVWWMITTLTDQVLGEIPHMRYIDAFDVLEQPGEGECVLLSALPDKLRDMGLDLSTNPEACMDRYTGYKMEPCQDPEADWRLDVIAGSTCCPGLVNGYLNCDDSAMDTLYADGVVAGFFCYPLDSFSGEDRSQQIFDFRDSLEDELIEGEAMECLTVTGGATGLYCGYLDFIAWDLIGALNAAKQFFEASPLPWASFHVFRRDAGTVRLKRPEEEAFQAEEQGEEPPLDDLEYIPYTPEAAEAFYQQIEQWNDADEYTRCIRVLDTIPEEWQDYRSAYALARALENYAVIGDRREGTPNFKGDKALLRAIEALQSVREEGQDKAQWNMRMAYGYQYLSGQEKKAIPYAQRWAELDPEDEDAPAVIRECQEANAKRSAAPKEEKHDRKGVFTGFVLLSRGVWDKAQFIRDMKEKWNIPVTDEDENDGTLAFEVGGMIGAVSLMPHPVPNGEAEDNAENNYMWPDAVKAAREHSAHILVAVVGKEETVLERGKLFVKMVAACCRQEYATGVYTSGVVFEPEYYESYADMLKEDELPIFNWVWFGLYRDQEGLSAYTCGMDVLGKDEMEVLNANEEPAELRNFLANIVSYVLENDVELHDGETIGFSETDKRRITRSEGVALPGQMTLKIAYESITNGWKRGEQDEVMEMDNAAWHLETLQKKKLPVEELNALSHMAIYLRWCMEHDLMDEGFMKQYGGVVKQVKADPNSVDLRIFLRDELDGRLVSSLFNKTGRAFASYYYGSTGLPPYYPGDIDNYTIGLIGLERNYSDEIQDEAYLFTPFDETYYQAMAQRIERRFVNWQGQQFDEATLEPSELARAMMNYLGCECTYFPAMKDDDPIMAAYSYDQRSAAHDGFVPVLVKVDETLWECLVMNTDPGSDGANGYTFDSDKVAEYRETMLAGPVPDGKAVLEKRIGWRKAEAEEDEMDWEQEVLGEMGGGEPVNRFASYWNPITRMTYPLILAKIPIKHPWEIFAYLPFGGWNDCPDTLQLMAAAKHWFEQYGAVPAAMTHDELEFILPAPIHEENAMETAIEQYGFCADLDQGDEGGIGILADTLRQSTVWYFWWD